MQERKLIVMYCTNTSEKQARNVMEILNFDLSKIMTEAHLEG